MPDRRPADPAPAPAANAAADAADAELADLLASATERAPLADAPGKSGAAMERLVIDGQPYVLKRLDPDQDWTLRASGCLDGPPLELWRRGVLDRLPDCINQPIVAVARPVTATSAPARRAPDDTAQGDTAPNGTAPVSPPRPGGCLVLMRDVSPWLVPATDAPISDTQHTRFLRHMAELHAAFWDCGRECDVVPAMHRYLELSPWLAEAEQAIGSAHLVPRLVAQGWPLLAEVAPAAAAVVTPLARDPGPLVAALETTPQTFVHSNWKLDNLGTDDQGRTVLLDWEQPGRGAALSDLAWYLAINCRRLPQSKEASIDTYRDCLEAQGIDTGSWWERQLGLCLLGALVQFGWEKALGGYDEELAWWEAKAVAAAPLLT